MVVCDGGKRDTLAYGSFKVFLEDKEVAHHFMIFGFGTSNDAEYLALINAVKFCLSSGYTKLIIRSDSALMLNQVSGNWRTKKPTLKKLRQIARLELAKLSSYSLEKIHNKEVKKILGH